MKHIILVFFLRFNNFGLHLCLLRRFDFYFLPMRNWRLLSLGVLAVIYFKLGLELVWFLQQYIIFSVVGFIYLSA